MRKVQVHTLPFPDDQKKNEGVNSFFQLDWIKSEKQLITATIHIAPQKIDYANLDYFNPEPTTPDAATHNYTATVGDKWNLFGGLLDNTLSATRFSANVWGQGPADLTITPTGDSGNYFEQQNRYSTRIGWSPTFAVKPVKKLGLHEFKIGTYIARSTEHGQVFEHPIDILNAAGLMTEQITFFGGREFQMADTEYAIFGQDHWTIAPHLAVDLGVRTESQEVSQSFRVAPRGGIVWTPFAKWGTTLRAGFGMFYDRVPLNVYAFNHYPKESIDYFDDCGADHRRPVPLRQHARRGGCPLRLHFPPRGSGRFLSPKRYWKPAGGPARYARAASACHLYAEPVAGISHDEPDRARSSVEYRRV